MTGAREPVAAEPVAPESDRVVAASEGDREVRRKRAQERRSLAIAVGLIALAVLFFVVTIVRLGGNVANRAY
ncbi:MAG: hypothetical protein GC150_01430 [Rhizobiales bacterium]|nr:hypothetical protein [Hyphomicrobiales bacterium]